MQVYILADRDGEDLIFRIVTEDKGLSPLYRETGRAQWINGNPYGVYGAAVEDFTGIPWKDTRIAVACFTSGNLRFE